MDAAWKASPLIGWSEIPTVSQKRGIG